MSQERLSFGEELRKRRISAGLSLSELAQSVHYSKGQLSKVERGIKPPSRQLARLADSALQADGELSALADSNAASRREVLTAGALAVPARYLGQTRVSTQVSQPHLTGIFRSLFDHYRNLGQGSDSSLLLPAVAAQTSAVIELARIGGGATRRELLVLGSRYAEYAGWLAQEMGNDLAALRWTQRAVELSNAVGDTEFAAYGLVRQGLVTMYMDDAAQTIQLANGAQASSLPPRLRGLAAAREAQGHALAGDHDAAMRAADRAGRLLSTATNVTGQPSIGSRNLADPAEMTRGWCLYDLGRPDEAAEVIGRELTAIPAQATRARARYGIRRALSHAAAGDIDLACQLTSDILQDVVRVRSATIAKDLRSLARVLDRHPRNPGVRALSPQLGTALSCYSTAERN